MWLCRKKIDNEHWASRFIQRNQPTPLRERAAEGDTRKVCYRTLTVQAMARGGEHAHLSQPRSGGVRTRRDKGD